MERRGTSSTTVTINYPPTSGLYVGQADAVEEQEDQGHTLYTLRPAPVRFDKIRVLNYNAAHCKT